jgi:hypothetical protein
MGLDTPQWQTAVAVAVAVLPLQEREAPTLAEMAVAVVDSRSSL